MLTTVPVSDQKVEEGLQQVRPDAGGAEMKGVGMMSAVTTCECGCGGRPSTPGCLFLRGHSMRIGRRALPLRTCPSCRSAFQARTARTKYCSRPCQFASQRGKTQQYVCVGYKDGDSTRFARRCPLRVDLLPSEVRSRQRAIDVRQIGDDSSLNWKRQKAFLDVGSHTMRCGFCSMGSMAVAILDQRIRNIGVSERIRTPVQRRKIMQEEWEDLRESVGLALSGGRSPAARSSFTTQHRDAIAASGIARRWKAGLRNTFVARCALCTKLMIGQGSPRRTHGPCFWEWMKTPTGQRWINSRRRTRFGNRGEAVFTLERKRGRPESRENLLTHFRWAILHYLGGESTRAIAASSGVSHVAVGAAVGRILESLPPAEFVPVTYRRHVTLLAAAVSEPKLSYHPWQD